MMKNYNYYLSFEKNYTKCLNVLKVYSYLRNSDDSVMEICADYSYLCNLDDSVMEICADYSYLCNLDDSVM